MTTIIYSRLLLALLSLALPSINAFSQSTKGKIDQEKTHVTEIQTPSGPVEVHWGQPDIHISESAPSFEQLDSNGDDAITREEAQVYLPLLNEFDYTDRNRNGSISKKEYDWWLKE